MAAAARDLDIQLEVIYAERDHVQMLKLANTIAQRPHKPDYLIIVNEKLATGEMLRVADQAGIKTFLLLNKFEAEQAREFGKPREKYRHWLGSLPPNNREAGLLTASALIERALKNGKSSRDGKLRLLAIAGDRAAPASIQRLEGLHQATEKRNDVVVEQLVYGNWERELAREQSAILLKRHPDITAIWAANDQMAFGAGHFTAGGWALVMLYDYHHGIDFASESSELNSPLFALIDKPAARMLVSRYGDETYSKIDFRQFSKKHAPQLRQYEFGLAPLLR